MHPLLGQKLVVFDPCIPQQLVHAVLFIAPLHALVAAVFSLQPEHPLPAKPMTSTTRAQRSGFIETWSPSPASLASAAGGGAGLAR